MTDPIQCIKCKAVSYNEPGKTRCYCGACYDEKCVPPAAPQGDREMSDLTTARKLVSEWVDGYKWALPHAAEAELQRRVSAAFVQVRTDERERGCQACRELKVTGTDGCRYCETGRVTMYTQGDSCLSCKLARHAAKGGA